MPRDYELGIIVNPDVGDEQARAIVERITQVIAAREGQVVRVNAVGRRRLAYPIDHHRDGLYFYFDLMVEPQSIAEIERTLRVNEEIIRHLLLVRDPRVVAQQREREAQAQAQAAERAALEVENAETVEAPVADEPDFEESGLDEPEVDEPEVDEPEVDEPEVDEPEVDEPEVDEPDLDEPEVEAESETETEAKA
jgi:small subunit ribosomal protein S6